MKRAMINVNCYIYQFKKVSWENVNGAREYENETK